MINHSFLSRCCIAPIDFDHENPNGNTISSLLGRYKSKTAFCAAIGISKQFLHLVLKGECKVSPNMAIAINKIHCVPLYMLRPDIYPKELFFKTNDD